MELDEFFRTHPKCALAFSGGADSAFLLWAGVQAGAELGVYYVKTAFQPKFELEDAKKLTDALGVPLRVIPLDVLAEPAVSANPADRCYHCKRALFGALAAQAQADGFLQLLDGTNASDDVNDRPGFRALGELGVCSPLRMCGITKPRLRELSKAAGLFTWNKPAYACLATRVEPGQPITPDVLRRVEQGEALLAERGYADFRLRVRGEGALLQVSQAQYARAAAELAELNALLAALFAPVRLDETPRETEVLPL